MTPDKPDTVSAYIHSFPAGVQKPLEEIRTAIIKAVPKAQETIKYAMPTFVYNGINIAHFAAFKNHIGFYPVPAGDTAIEKELSAYATGKGSVQFPLDQPMPLQLIIKIVKYNVHRSTEKANKQKAENI